MISAKEAKTLVQNNKPKMDHILQDINSAIETNARHGLTSLVYGLRDSSLRGAVIDHLQLKGFKTRLVRDFLIEVDWS